jgi:dihydrofolate reductase
MSIRLSVFIATSLDGYIARPDGGLDWLDLAGGPGGEDYGYGEFIASVDAVVLGRRTFDFVAGLGEWPYGSRRVIVLSRSLRPDDLRPDLRGRLEVSRQAPAEVLGVLERERLAHAYVDGGTTIQAFLRAGLIDRMTISRLPVLLGAGIPLFGALDGDRLFRHVATRAYPSGLVQSTYEAA